MEQQATDDYIQNTMQQEILEESKTPMSIKVDGNIDRDNPVFPADNLNDEIRDKVRELGFGEQHPSAQDIIEDDYSKDEFDKSMGI